MGKFIVLGLMLPLLGASMCEAKVAKVEKEEVPEVVKQLVKPMKQVPKEYKDALKAGQDRLEKSIEASGGAP